MIFLPRYRVAFATAGDRPGAKVEVLIGAYELDSTLIDPQAIDWEERSDTRAPAVRIDPHEATLAAREALLRARLSQSSWRGPLDAQQATVCVELVGYPYWVYYFEPKRGKLDAKLLDAVTGSPAGPKARLALLRALAAR